MQISVLNTRLSIPLAILAIVGVSVAVAQTYPSFPGGGDVDRRTLRVQEQVEQLYVQGDYNRAYFIYRNELAPKGDKYAQYMIGYMHLTGAGQPQDPAIALAWYRLAAERGEAVLVQARDQLEASLGADQVAHADNLTADLKRELGDRVLILELVQKDLEILRESTGHASMHGASHVTIYDRRQGYMSSAQYYQVIKKRLETRLNYLKSQVDIIDVADESDDLDLTEIESEMRELIAEIDANQK